MKSDKFSERLDLLRRAFIDGPIVSLTDLQRALGTEPGGGILQPGYCGPIGETLRRRVAITAADLLGLDSDGLEAWLVGEGSDRGERYWPEIPWIDEYLRWLPTQVCCTRCGEWFDRGSEVYVGRFRRCRPCVRATQNPSAGLYEELLLAKLPEIRARCPALADALQLTLDAREAPTYERLAARAQLSAIVVARILKGMGLDKRNMPNLTKVTAKRKLSGLTVVAVMLSTSLHAAPRSVEPPTMNQERPSSRVLPGTLDKAEQGGLRASWVMAEGAIPIMMSVSTLIEGPMSEVIEGAGAFPVSASR